MASFAIPLSGLEASSSQLNVIGNNLANLNTDGYKDENLTFGDIFNQIQGTSGNGDPIQTGSGVQIDGTVSNFTNGSVSSPTGQASNMALQGNGFFVVENGTEMNYTRDGDFTVNNLGQITTANGELVMGYPAVNGQVSTTGALGPISVSGSSTIPAVATTSFSTETNLEAGSTPPTTFANTPITVYDSLGTAQTLNIQYTSTGPNTWSYSISMAPQELSNATPGGTTSTYNFGTSGGTVATVDPSTNLTITGPTAGGGTATITAPTVTAGESVASYATALQAAVTAAGITGPVTVASTAGGQLTITGANFTTAGSVMQEPVGTNTTGTLTFNSSGELIQPTGNLTGITFGGLSDGAAPLNLSWNLNGSSGSPTITQQATASATTASAQNGFAAGTLTGYSVLANGVVEGQFSNNQTLALGQIAVANFANPEGLTQSSDGDFQATSASGGAVIGQAGLGGNGTITGGAVEESNVNLSNEFANMIVAQQTYEANAKVLTTLDQVSQATIQLIT